MPGAETPQEFWERMRTGGSAGAPPSAWQAPRQAESPSAQAPRQAEPPSAWQAPRQAGGRSEPPGSGAEDPSAGELVKRLSEQTKALVRQELRLAQLELQQKGKRIGVGAGMVGGGGLVGIFAAAAVTTALILVLSTAIAAWLAALIVGVVLLLAAGGMALIAKKQLQRATPPAPEEAIGSVKRDVETVKQRAHT